MAPCIRPSAPGERGWCWRRPRFWAKGVCARCCFLGKGFRPLMPRARPVQTAEPLGRVPAVISPALPNCSTMQKGPFGDGAGQDIDPGTEYIAEDENNSMDRVKARLSVSAAGADSVAKLRVLRHGPFVGMLTGVTSAACLREGRRRRPGSRARPLVPGYGSASCDGQTTGITHRRRAAASSAPLWHRPFDPRRFRRVAAATQAVRRPLPLPASPISDKGFPASPGAATLCPFCGRTTL